MKILSFDTTNVAASVAISEGERILAYSEEIRPSMQAETIMPMIHDVLNSAKLTYKELDLLAVTNGPGSFTGIRIGLSVAHGIILGSQLQGVAISNLELAYFRASNQVRNYDKIFIFLNAYRGQLYCQIFDNKGKHSIPTILDYGQALLLLQQEKGIIVCAGNGLELIYEKIKEIPGDTSTYIILPRFPKIKAMHICRYVITQLAQGRLLNYNLIPLYIRPPDAKTGS